MSRDMRERTTVRVPEELVRRAKRKAAAEGRTLTSLIEEGLRVMVMEEAGPSKGARVLPRVSIASGGALPGIDLTHSSSLMDIDDLRLVPRIKSRNTPGL
jgi:hypothetical protein